MDLQTGEKIIMENCLQLSPKENCNQKLKEIKSGLSLKQINDQIVPMRVDQLFHLYIIHNPNEFIQQIYCYYIFKKIINIKETPPELFPYIIQGSSLSMNEKDQYNHWLINTIDGHTCTQSVMKILGIKPSLLEKTFFDNKKYVLFLNPVSFLEQGAGDLFQKTGAKIFNHERLHLVYAESKNKIRLKKLWKTKSNVEKENFKKQHSSYNFTNENILMKEFFSYTFENDPLKGEALLSH